MRMGGSLSRRVPWEREGRGRGGVGAGGGSGEML